MNRVTLKNANRFRQESLFMTAINLHRHPAFSSESASEKAADRNPDAGIDQPNPWRCPSSMFQES